MFQLHCDDSQFFPLLNIYILYKSNWNSIINSNQYKTPVHMTVSSQYFIFPGTDCVYAVDAMSSFGAVPLDLQEARVDYLVTASNNCLEGVPGFSIVIANTEHLLSCEGSMLCILHWLNSTVNSCTIPDSFPKRWYNKSGSIYLAARTFGRLLCIQWLMISVDDLDCDFVTEV